MSNGWTPLVATAIAVFVSGSSLAQDASTDPKVLADNAEVVKLAAETARLSAETALLNAQKANIAAKYGDAPTAPEGNISELKNFTALTQWAHAEAISEMGAEIPQKVAKALDGPCKAKTIFVTSIADGRPAYVAANEIKGQLERLTLRLKAPVTKSRSVAGGAAVVKGVAGTLDSLVALFRSDYTIEGLATAEDGLALRMEIAQILATQLSWESIHVDGLERAPVADLPVMKAYRDFAAALDEAIIRKKIEKDAASKDELAGIIAEAQSFDSAITGQPTSGGQSPLVTAALAQERPAPGDCVLLATYSIAMSAVRRKKLFSRNDHVTAVTGGLLKVAVFDSTGALVVADVVPIRSKFSQDLKSLEK